MPRKNKYRVWLEDQDGKVIVEKEVPVTDKQIKDCLTHLPFITPAELKEEMGVALDNILEAEACYLLDKTIRIKWTRTKI